MFVMITLIVLLHRSFSNQSLVINRQWYYYGNRQIQCYSCTDCPEPFIFSRAQTFLTPPSMGECMVEFILLFGLFLRDDFV